MDREDTRPTAHMTTPIRSRSTVGSASWLRMRVRSVTADGGDTPAGSVVEVVLRSRDLHTRIHPDGERVPVPQKPYARVDERRVRGVRRGVRRADHGEASHLRQVLLARSQAHEEGIVKGKYSCVRGDGPQVGLDAVEAGGRQRAVLDAKDNHVVELEQALDRQGAGKAHTAEHADMDPVPATRGGRFFGRGGGLRGARRRRVLGGRRRRRVPGRGRRRGVVLCEGCRGLLGKGRRVGGERDERTYSRAEEQLRARLQWAPLPQKGEVGLGG